MTTHCAVRGVRLAKAALFTGTLALAASSSDAQNTSPRPVNEELSPGVWGRVDAPDGAGPFPAVILIHGGSGERPEHADFAADLNDHGYLTVILAYYGPSGERPPSEETDRHWYKWQEMLQRAVRYTASLEAVGDRDIALMGWSRGAILAIASAPSIQRVDAVVDFYGGLCGGLAPPGCRDESAEARSNREEKLKDLPPLLILHGGADPVIDVSQAHRLHELVSAFGGDVEISVYPGAVHAFDFPISRPERYDDAATKDAWQRIYTFLGKHLAN